MPQISTGKLPEWSIFKGDNRAAKTDNSRYCPIWNTFLQTISPLCHITLDVLLFGDSSLSINTNTSIFTALQKFIVETKRF